MGLKDVDFTQPWKRAKRNVKRWWNVHLRPLVEPAVIAMAKAKAKARF